MKELWLSKQSVLTEREAAGAVDSGASPSYSRDDSNAEKEVKREDSDDTRLARNVPDTSGKDTGKGEPHKSFQYGKLYLLPQRHHI